MKNIFRIILALEMIWCTSIHAQVIPAIEWQKCLGGSSEDLGTFVQQIAGGGFIVAGVSNSNDGDVSGNFGNYGSYEYWIVRLDSDGNLVWQKSFGGTGDDEARSIQQTADGGFIIAGYSNSNDGDISENHGDYDYWIVKLDSAGNLVWEKSLGGSEHDAANSIQQTTDGGFVIAGSALSNDGDVSGNHGLMDFWIVKLDITGNLVWQKLLGGSNYDEASSIQQTTDGGFIVAGLSSSTDGDVSGNHGGTDYWIVKLDTAGNLVWEKSFGGSENDAAQSIQQTTDGGFIVAGWSWSNDGDVSGNHGSTDDWIVKLDVNGNLVWERSLGGSINEAANSIQQTTDGGFVIGGESISTDGDVTGNHGSDDYWIVKLDATGDLIWEKCLGGYSYDVATSICQTTDNGFIVGGMSASTDGDVTGNHGEYEYWIVKLTSDSSSGILSPSDNFISFYPNPVQTQLFINLTTPANEVSIRVYDLQGRMIALPATFINSQAQLNITILPDGFYTLQITNRKTRVSEVAKLVKGE